MGSWRTGRHHDSIELVFLDDLDHQFLSILGTGEQISLHMDHARQGRCVVGDILHVDVSGNIGAAVADKDPDA